MKRTLVAVCLLLLAAPGCEDSETVELLEGRDYDEMRLVAIHRGQSTRDDVRELLGEPWRQAGKSEAEEWEYYVRYRRTPSRTLGIFPAGKVEVSFKRLVVYFKGDFVDRVQKESSRDAME